jgi:hypothetical protein
VRYLHTEKGQPALFSSAQEKHHVVTSSTTTRGLVCVTFNFGTYDAFVVKIGPQNP